MKFTVLALSALSLVSADNVRAANESRRLSFESIAGYAPGSQVTDHCAIDADQKAMETELSKATDDAYALAKEIYSTGANSKSYAQIELTAGLTTPLNKGKEISGTDKLGRDVNGKIYAAYAAGDTSIRFQYATTDIQKSHVGCQVGALGTLAQNVDGCLVATGSITVDGASLAYTYDVNTDNNNGRTISGFSTKAEEKMADYTDFKYFKAYYGVGDYADQWVNAALDGTATAFTNGNADFSEYDFTGRTEAIKKGTVYLNIFMYVIREFEDAIDDCTKGCIDCNDAPVHAWDEGVCFYTGSLEESLGTSDGKLLHQLADKRCQNFKTCGKEGNEVTGNSKMNIELFNLLKLGQEQLLGGLCDAAEITTASIAQKMYIPMIQGTLRYAYKVGAQEKGEKEAAEGAVFAAAVLPRVHAADPAAAKVIYDNMRVGAPSTDFAAVKTAFESVYDSIGIKCEDIGGLFNDADNSYYAGMEPCGLPASSAATTTLAVAAAVGAAALML